MNKLQEKADSLELGLYIHVPFCARSCDFCHFYQEPPKRSDLDAWLDGMDISMGKTPLPRVAGTAFWGGGTPGLLPVRDLERLCRMMIRANQGVVPREWSVEMAPATVKKDKIAALMDHGVTRISMGVQTFQPDLLDALGRIHSLEQVERAIDTLNAVGMDNFNLDMIFAIPGQTLGMWQQDLERVIKARPRHVSTYCLTFEEDTALWLRLQKGQVRKHSIEDEARFHELSWQILGDAGFRQYEVSNYSREGSACQHNLNTWRMQEWIGFGPSASSQLGMRRWTEPHSLEQWLGNLKSGKSGYAEEVNLTHHMLAQDFLIFGLRMNAGVNLSEWHARFGTKPLAGWESLMQSLIEEGLAVRQGERIRLSDAGRLVADRIGEEILGLE